MALDQLKINLINSSKTSISSNLSRGPIDLIGTVLKPYKSSLNTIKKCLWVGWVLCLPAAGAHKSNYEMLVTRVRLGKWECFSLLRKVHVCVLIQKNKLGRWPSGL